MSLHYPYLRYARRSAFWLLLLPLSAAAAQAQTTIPSGEAAPELQVVVVTNGEVFQGPVEEESLGYMVTVWNGRVFVPFDQVRAVGTSLSDAYSRISSGLTNPTANDHINLAVWCLKHRLVTEAKQELTSALELEPTRSEARELLARIEARHKEQSDLLSGPPTKSSEATYAGNELPRNLISRESTAQFIRTIQPLVSNRCGNAACHGSGHAGNFQFQPARSGLRLDRTVSMENLDAALRQINLDVPDASPLLTVPSDGRSPHNRVFVGRLAELQKGVLSKWVKQVASEIAATRPTVKKPSQITLVHHTEDEPRRVDSNQSTLLTEPIPVPGEVPHLLPEQPGTVRKPIDETFLRSLAQQRQPDPFDPEEFNRKVHGTTQQAVVNE